MYGLPSSLIFPDSAHHNEVSLPASASSSAAGTSAVELADPNSCCSIYITSQTPKSGSSKVVATKKVSPRKCSPRLGVVGSEDEDDSSDIGEDTMPEVFPSSPISLLSKGTYATH